jgi:hypothetical protein
MRNVTFSALLALAAAWACPTYATTFTGVVNVGLPENTDPGLVVAVQPVGSDYSFSFDLNSVGDSASIPLFTLASAECCANLDDFLVPHEINATFDFSSPDADGLVTGITGSLFILNYVLWAGPVNVAFGDGGLLSVSLSNAIFGFSGSSAATISAEFKLISEPLVAAPLPPAALLLGTALFGMGFVSRRKRAVSEGLKRLMLRGAAA